MPTMVKLSSNLVIGEHDIWVSTRLSRVSYPAEGNRACFCLEDDSFWFKHRNDCIVAAMKRYPPSGPILDVGGGNGYVTRRMLDEGFDAVLLEPGPVGAFNAKTHRHIPEVICSTLQDAGFSPNSVDAIGCFDVVEHIEDDRAFIEHIHTLLKPSGMLYVTVPAHQWLWSINDVTAQHFRRYTHAKLFTLLGDKFDLRFHTYFFGALMLPILLLRTIPSQLGLVKRRGLLDPESEHGETGGASVSLMRTLLQKEVRKIALRRPMSTGTSCLLVAQKR